MARIDGGSIPSLPPSQPAEPAAPGTDTPPPGEQSGPAPVDAFDAGGARQPSDGGADGGAWNSTATIPAARLLVNPGAAWDAGARDAGAPDAGALDGGAPGAGPEVRREPITTDTTPAKAPPTMREVHVNVPWISQYDPNVELKDWRGNVIPTEWPAPPDGGTPRRGSPRDIACAAAAKEMLNRAGATWSGRSIDVADAKDANGRIVPNPARARQGRDAIDAQLDAGKPVLVGVMWNTPTPGLNGGNADHFVVITGRGVDEQGRVFYTFNEPGVSANRGDVGTDARKENRFYVDESTGMLYRPGSQQRGGYESSARLEVSRVCLNR